MSGALAWGLEVVSWLFIDLWTRRHLRWLINPSTYTHTLLALKKTHILMWLMCHTLNHGISWQQVNSSYSIIHTFRGRLLLKAIAVNQNRHNTRGEFRCFLKYVLFYWFYAHTCICLYKYIHIYIYLKEKSRTELQSISMIKLGGGGIAQRHKVSSETELINDFGGGKKDRSLET